MDAEAVRAAYRRWAGVYDAVFGGICLLARRRAVALVNRLPGRDVLEVGVGTGLALPYYARGPADHRHRPLRRDAGAGPQARGRPRDRQRRRAARDGRGGDRLPGRLVRHRGGDVRRLGGAAPARAAGGDAARGAAGRQHPVRQPFRRRERAAVVDRARPGARVARPRLASRLHRGGAVRARGPAAHHRDARCRRSASSSWSGWSHGLPDQVGCFAAGPGRSLDLAHAVR